MPVLARLRGLMHCGSPACRDRHERHGTSQRREEHERLARQQVIRRWPADAAAPTVAVWLEPHATPRLVKRKPVETAAFEQHLLAAAALALQGQKPDLGKVEATEAADILDDLPQSATPAPQPGALCAHCAGRCCRIGLASHAFVDAALLERWVERHPGSGVAHALQAYVGALPERHVQGSCLFHGARGCALPRDDRSAVCNRFACDALQQVQQTTAVQPGTAVIASTGVNGRAHRTVFIAPDGRTQKLKDPAP